MCGFIGCVSKNNIDINLVKESNLPVICRGPDKTTELFSTSNDLFEINENNMNIAVIFNRLSILELTDLGDQPKLSKIDKTMLMFNGEIYNFQELKKDLVLKGISFRAKNSDSEVLFNGLNYYGIDFINKLIGQFSIVYLDFKNKNLYLIRDRVGQKPLFYQVEKNNIFFGSNLKSIYSLNKTNKISSSQITNYLNFGVISSPRTIFDKIFKVSPGSYIKVDLKTFELDEVNYWNPVNFIGNNKFDEEEFFDLFSRSVKHRLVSDVPVANFLSGGIDSTSIVKNMFDNDVNQINTFTVSVNNKTYDESNWAKQVSDKYNTKHRVQEINSEFSTELILESIDAYDELYSDPSTVPTYMISKAISKNFKVALSGDGGDELLGGYERTKLSIERKTLPNSVINILQNIYPNYFGSGQKILFRQKDNAKSYSSFFDDKNLLNMLNLKTNINFSDNYFINLNDDYKELLVSDYLFYLPEMMMLKVDRASMANSLEVRSPFVDNKLIEYILKTDSNFTKLNQKYLLKKYLENDFNGDFLNRKKQGFVFDMENWVYNNLNFISEIIKNGNYVNEMNKNIISLLGRRKTRINALRIWKLFLLERYINNLENN